MFLGGIPGVAGTIGRYVLLDDIETKVRVVDMTTGEIVITESRADTQIVTISPDGSTLMIPRDKGITLIDLATGHETSFPRPETDASTPTAEGIEGASPTLAALSPNGACAAVSWSLGEEETESVLLVAGSGEQIALPGSIAPGWIPRGSE
jgi:hypothetical protein